MGATQKQPMRLHLFLIIGAFLVVPLSAQAQDAAPVPPPTECSKEHKAAGRVAPATSNEPAAEPSIDRQMAYALLDSLAQQAKSIGDDVSRIRVQIRIADVWWMRDPKVAQKMFEQIFDRIDTLSESATDPRKAPVDSRSELRVEALNAVFKHDQVLGEHMAEAMEDDFDDVTAFDLPMGESSEYARVLCRIAVSQASNDPASAANIARQSLNYGLALEFPSALAAVDSTDSKAAKDLAIYTLDRIGLESNNPADLWLLSDFVFESNYGPSVSTSESSLDLERHFLDAAARVFSRYVGEHPVGATTPNAEVYASYALGVRLAPEFDRVLPQQSLNFRSLVLRVEQLVPVDRRDRILAAENSARTGEPSVGIGNGDGDPARRDSVLIAESHRVLLTDGYDRAKAVANRISDDGERARTLDDLARSGAQLAGDARRFDEVLTISKDVSDPSERARLIVRAARTAAGSNDRQRAVELLDEAQRVLEKFSAGDPLTRAATLAQLSNAYASIDTLRAFEVVSSAVSAFNKAIWRSNPSSSSTEPGTPNPALTETLKGVYPQCDLSPGLEILGRTDYYRALTSAQSIGNRPLSILGQLSVVRGVLATERHKSPDKPKATSAPEAPKETPSGATAN